MRDLIIVGAGPCGLACAIATRQRGLDVLVIEKGCLVNTVFRMPAQMTFFSTPELLAIGGVPFIVPGEKPTRSEALQYFRRVAEAFSLPVNLYERVETVDRDGGGFTLRTVQGNGEPGVHRARAVVMATGYYDTPNLLGVSGEDLPKVSHYYTEGHPYAGLDVLVVGGANSAVEAALDLQRAGARVTLVHRGAGLGPKVKPWVRPVIESVLEKGNVRALFRSRVTAIAPGAVEVETGETRQRLANDFVFAMTGYRPDHGLLRRLGVEIDGTTGEPRHDPETMETNVPGLYLTGVIAAGFDANKIFIENGRFHGEKIVTHLQRG